jgi:hypothetical protein
MPAQGEGRPESTAIRAAAVVMEAAILSVTAPTTVTSWEMVFLVPSTTAPSSSRRPRQGPRRRGEISAPSVDGVEKERRRPRRHVFSTLTKPRIASSRYANP